MDEQQQTETTLPARFRQLAHSHGIEAAEPDSDPLGWYESGNHQVVYHAALGTLAAQAAERVARDMEHILHADGAPKDEHDVALMLALFLYARQAGEDARIVVGDSVFGDHEDQALTQIRIEPNAKRGDFDIDMLVSLKDYGPHPNWMNTREGPSSLTVVTEAALLCKGTRNYAQAELNRWGLASLGLTPVIYDSDEVERDPFALDRRVVDDLNRAARDRAQAA